jgi:hypothetical protein
MIRMCRISTVLSINRACERRAKLYYSIGIGEYTKEYPRYNEEIIAKTHRFQQ